MNQAMPIMVGGFKAYDALHLQRLAEREDLQLSIAWVQGVREMHMHDREFTDAQSALNYIREWSHYTDKRITRVLDVEGLIQLPEPMAPKDYHAWRATNPELVILNPYTSGKKLEVLS